jgi:TrmH family RNA methyltransferase
LDTIALGKHNPRLIEIRKALQHGALTQDGLLAVEGPKLIREAQDSGVPTVALFAREGAAMMDLAPRADVYVLEAAAFKKIQTTETSQGLIALVRLPTYAIADLTVNPSGPIVVLDRLQDPGNVGTIFRIAEAFGAAGCIGLADTVRPYNPKAVRASAGSVLRLPHVWNLSLDEALSSLQNAGIPLVGTAPRSDLTVADWNWRAPVAVLIGNEGRGLDPHEARACEAVLRIPHRDRVESLNSAIAAAVVLYESFRQRGLQ